MNESLSQQEIDALLRMAMNPEAEETLTPEEMDALGEIGNISMGTAATTLSVLINRKVTITTPKVSTTTVEALQKAYPLPCVAVEIHYIQGLQGSNVLILKDKDAKIITDLLMGGAGTADEGPMNEMHISAVGEVMNQMIGSASTSLASIFQHPINISPPSPTLMDLSTGQGSAALTQDKPLIQVAFDMEIEGLLRSQIMQIMPLSFGKSMVEKLFLNEAASPQVPVLAPERPEVKKSEPPPKVEVKPVEFQAFPSEDDRHQKVPDNMDLIMDVPLTVTVELGKTRRPIRDILKIGAGSIIELDRLAGEPVDILVNGKYIATGEVVVIDENFGVRINDIISPAKRVQKLG